MNTKIELLRSEIKKAEKFAEKMTGRPVVVTGWFTDSIIDDLGFITFQLEVCDKETDERLDDVFISAFTHDRRKSRACGFKPEHVFFDEKETEEKRDKVVSELNEMAFNLSKNYTFDLYNEIFDKVGDYNREHEDNEIFVFFDEEEGKIYVEDNYYIVAGWIDEEPETETAVQETETAKPENITVFNLDPVNLDNLIIS